VGSELRKVLFGATSPGWCPKFLFLKTPKNEKKMEDVPQSQLIFWVRTLRDELVLALAASEAQAGAMRAREEELSRVYAALDAERLRLSQCEDECSKLRGKLERSSFAKVHHRQATERAAKALELLSRVDTV